MLGTGKQAVICGKGLLGIHGLEERNEAGEEFLHGVLRLKSVDHHEHLV